MTEVADHGKARPARSVRHYARRQLPKSTLKRRSCLPEAHSLMNEQRLSIVTARFLRAHGHFNRFFDPNRQNDVLRRML